MGITKCKTCEYHCDKCDEILEEEMKNKHSTNHGFEDSLCWCCSKSCPSKDNYCSWSKSRKPVIGWTARKTRVIDGYTHYKVYSCPDFVRGR